MCRGCGMNGIEPRVVDDLFTKFKLEVQAGKPINELLKDIISTNSKEASLAVASKYYSSKVDEATLFNLFDNTISSYPLSDSNNWIEASKKVVNEFGVDMATAFWSLYLYNQHLDEQGIITPPNRTDAPPIESENGLGAVIFKSALIFGIGWGIKKIFFGNKEKVAAPAMNGAPYKAPVKKVQKVNF